MKWKNPKHNGNPASEAQCQQFIEVARNYLGVPWRHLGRDHTGLDCAGLLIAVINDVLNVCIEVSDYATWPNPLVMREMCRRLLLPGNLTRPIPGEVVLMKAPGYGVVHLGWFAGDTVIHASNEPAMKKVVETSAPAAGFYGVFQVPYYEV